MKRILLYVSCIVMLVMSSCNILENDNDQSPFICNRFPCDSTGTPKYDFNRNEPIYFAIYVQNITDKQIRYRKVTASSTLFDVACSADVDSLSPSVENSFPPALWGDFILQPSEIISQIQSFPASYLLPVGKCKAVFCFRFYFNREYEEYIDQEQMYVKFKIRDEN